MTQASRLSWEQRAASLKIEGRAFIHGEYCIVHDAQT